MFSTLKSFKNVAQPNTPRRTLSFIVGVAIIVAGMMFAGPPSTAKEDSDASELELPECADKPASNRLYTKLRERHISLRQRELSLDREAEMLNTKRTELTQKIEELRTLRGEVDRRIEAWEVKDDASHQERINHLVGVLAEVPAPSAARILLELDAKLAVDVLTHCDKTRAGEIFAAIPPDRAATFAGALADSKPRP